MEKMIQFDWYSPEFFHTEVHGPLEEEHVLLGNLVTLPETNSSPLKNDGWKLEDEIYKFLSGPGLFSGMYIFFNQSSGVLAQRLVSDIYWSNEMTSGASWLNI